MFWETLRILRLLTWKQWRVFRNTFRQQHILAKLALGLVVLVVLGCTFSLSSIIVDAFNDPLSDESSQFMSEENQAFIRQLMLNMPSILAAVASIVFIFSGITHAWSSLFFSKDMQQLMLAPIPTRAIFTSKLLQGYSLSSMLVLFFGFLLPLGIYGLVLAAPWYFYLALLMSAVLLPILPLLIGALITTLLVRIIPGKRIKEVIGMITGLFSISIYLASQFFFNIDPDKADQIDLSWVSVATQPWVPTHWIGSSLTSLAIDQSQLSYLPGLIWAVLMIGLLVGASIALEKIYSYGWLALQSSPEKRKKQRLPGLQSWQRWQGQTRALLQKERRLLLRDSRNFMLIVWPLAFMGMWVWQTVTRNSIDPQDVLTSRFVGLGFIAVVLFVIQSINSQLGLASISREHEHYWILRIAPFSSRRLYWSKWLFAWLVYPILSIPLLTIGLAFKIVSVEIFILGIIAISLIGIGATALLTGFGAAYPNLAWEHPNRMVSRRAGCLGRVISLMYIVISLVLWTLISLQFTGSNAFMNINISSLVSFGAFILFVVLTVIALWSSSNLAITKLNRFEYE